MPNIIPVPIFATTHFYVPYDDNPATKIVSVGLNLTYSLPSDGHTLTGQITSIRWQPAGQTATVTDSTTLAPTISNIDASIPGTIVVLAVVQDDNPDPTLRKSYDAIFPRQNGATAAFGRGAYAGIGPVPSQICYISVKTPSGLTKPGQYQRDWIGMTGGYSDLVDTVDGLTSSTADLLAGTGRFDDLYEKTATHGIHVHSPLDIREASEIRLRNALDPSYNYGVIDGNYDADTSVYIRSSSNRDIRLFRLASLGSQFSSVVLRGGYVEISGGVPGTSEDLRTGGIKYINSDGALTLRGSGSHTADVRVDVIESDTNNAGIILKGRGTRAYDVAAGAAVFDTVNGRNPNHQAIWFYNQYLGFSTTGTTEEMVFSKTVPVGAFDDTATGGKFALTSYNGYAANSNVKRWKVRVFDGTNTVELANVASAVNNATALGRLHIMINGTSGPETVVRVALETQSSSPLAVFEFDETTYLVLTGTAWTFSLWAQTASAAGDMSVYWASLVYEPPVA